MSRVLVLGRRRRLWPRTSLAELLRWVKKRGELRFSAAQTVASSVGILKFLPIAVYGKLVSSLGCTTQAQDIVGDRFNDVPENAAVIRFCLTTPTN
jgi:hypothetical protein